MDYRQVQSKPSEWEEFDFPSDNNVSSFNKYVAARELVPINKAPLVTRAIVRVLWFAVFVAVMFAIATFLFGMGDWKLSGTKFYDWFYLTLRLCVILALFYHTIVLPINAVFVASKIKKSYQEMFNYPDKSIGEFAHFAIRYWNSVSVCNIAASLICAAIAIFLHDLMILGIGNPWADILTITILILGTKVLTFLFFLIPDARLSKENPCMYEAVV